MRTQIRHGVFETNSSSTHSLIICTEEDFEAFRRGEKILHWDDTLVDAAKYKEDHGRYPDEYRTFDQMGDYFEFYTEHFTTPSGDKMVAFGEYGYDG